MNISHNLETFRAFATAMKDDGNESAVIRATETTGFGRKRLQVSVAFDDKAYAFFRSDDAKSANIRTRDIFFKTVAKEIRSGEMEGSADEYAFETEHDRELAIIILGAHDGWLGNYWEKVPIK